MIHVMVTFRPDGTIKRETQSRTFTLKQMQDAVGGFIEGVPHLTRYETHKGEAWAGEEGRLKGLPSNEEATRVWLANLGEGPFLYKPQIFGNMIFIYKEKG